MLRNHVWLTNWTVDNISEHEHEITGLIIA